MSYSNSPFLGDEFVRLPGEISGTINLKEMILVKADLSFRGNLPDSPVFVVQNFCSKEKWTQQCWKKTCGKDRDVEVFQPEFVLQKLGIANISNISTSISRFDSYVCVFSLWGTIRHTIYVFLTWGLNFNHFNQWHFHQPPGNGTILFPYHDSHWESL